MHTVTVEVEISSAHFLENYVGKCAKLHGHNWIIFVTVGAESLGQYAMVVDFSEVKKIINTFDHTLINDHPEWCTRAQYPGLPTAEQLAVVLRDMIQEKIDGRPNHPKVLSVRVFEDARSQAECPQDAKYTVDF